MKMMKQDNINNKSFVVNNSRKIRNRIAFCTDISMWDGGDMERNESTDF